MALPGGLLGDQSPGGQLRLPTRKLFVPGADYLQDVAYNPKQAGLEDFYPATFKDHGEMIAWCTTAFIAADKARWPYQRKWERYYKLYRSFIERRPGDWHSKVFVPIVFWVVEAIAPRLVANMPKGTVLPVGPEDVLGARMMEQLLDWSSSQANVFIELVKAVKQALQYGTGILKTYERQDVRRARRPVQGPARPVMGQQQVPIPDPQTGLPMRSPDGAPLTDTREVVMAWLPGGWTWEPYQYLAYDGPGAEAVDLFNFWVAPEADDVQTARYVIQRVYRDFAHVLQKAREGVYRLPEWLSPDEMTTIEDDPHLRRLSLVNLGTSAPMDATRRPCELLEIHTEDGRVITMLNRKAIIRAHEEPFDHGEKPFVRIVDYFNPHEFWGTGEIEPLEGLQDLTNAITNQRVDNIRLILNKMFGVNMRYIEDVRDLTPRPGGIIRTKDDLPPDQVIKEITFGDVTASAFAETREIQTTVEKVSGVTGYQLGMDSPSMNDTATGVQIITEQGASRFGLKTKLMELMGLKDLYRQFGGLIQQFVSPEKTIRILGPMGQWLWQTYDPQSLAGAFDYDIESSSAAQTEGQRRSDSLSLLQVLASFVPQSIPALAEDVLMAFGKKDVSRYLLGMPMVPQIQPPEFTQGQPLQGTAGAEFAGQMGVPGMAVPQMPQQGPQPLQPGMPQQGQPGMPVSPQGMPYLQPQPLQPTLRLMEREVPSLPPTVMQRGPAH